MGEYGLLLQSMGFLIIIIVLAYLAVRFGLRSVYRGLNGGYMKVLERTPLDHKSGSALVLVQIGKEVYLVGTAQGSVTLLKTIDWQDLHDEDEQGGVQSVGVKGSFSRLLRGLKKNGDDHTDDTGGGSR